MERLVLLSIIFFSGLWAVNGALATAPVAGRKGYDPRRGALAGALVGFLGSLLPGLLVQRVWPDRGGIAVIVALLAGWIALLLLWKYAPERDPQTGTLPSGAALKRNIIARHVRGSISRTLFLTAIAIALLALATLLATIINKAVGLTAVQYALAPEALTISAYDPGAPLGELDESAIPAVLAENVRPMRLQELILEAVIGAKPQQWDALKGEPLAAALDGHEYPDTLADVTINDLTPQQAAGILALNLPGDDLQLLAYIEAGRSFALLSDAEVRAVLAERLSVEQLHTALLQYAAEIDADALPAAVDALSAADAAELLVAQLERATVEELLIIAIDAQTLEDMPEQTLGSLLAVNMRKARLRVLVYDEIIGGTREEYPARSQETIGALLDDDAYPANLTDVPFGALSEAQYADLLVRNMSRDDLVDVLTAEVLIPNVAKGWTLWESLTDRAAIEAYQQENFPRASLEWRSWVNKGFLSNSINYAQPDATGVRPALYGTLMIILVTIVFAFPIGVGAAIYLEEYAGTNRLNQIIQTNINNLAGVPSIIYGMLGLAIFVRAMEHITSGAAFGTGGQNGRTVLTAGLTLALLILPVIIINAQEAIRAVPSSLRQASYGLGATKWQTIWNHVLPYAMPGIMTGTILAISRAIGETAPLILVGGATYLTQDPDGPFAQFTALPLIIYRLTTLPQNEFRYAAAAAILVLLALLLTLNSIAVILRNRFSRRLT